MGLALRRVYSKITPIRFCLVQAIRQSWTSSSFDWRWQVAPAQQKVLAARAWQLYQAKASTLRCADLDKDLSLLETHGVDTRALQPQLCACMSEPRGMRDVTELYQRLVAWGVSCTSKEGT